MKITIRSERISDYNAITSVNYEAFLGWRPDNPFISESFMVDLLRHNSMFNPELSLVAELAGEIIGHVLFSPFKFIVLGREQPGVVVGPVAVYPKYQRKGIGKMLMEEGHRRAAEKGVTFSLLCGHPEYYPKFGYKTKMFSVSGTKVSLSAEDFTHDDFSERPVNTLDIPWIIKSWERVHGHDHLALFPGNHVSEWNNHGQECRCTVVLRKGQTIGYARYVRSNPLRIKELLAMDGEMADMLAYLAWKHYGKAQGELHLSLSEEIVNAGIAGKNYVKVVDERADHDAFMIKVLDQQNSDIMEYSGLIEKGDIKPGIIVFPPMYDLDDGRVD